MARCVLGPGEQMSRITRLRSRQGGPAYPFKSEKQCKGQGGTLRKQAQRELISLILIYIRRGWGVPLL